MHQPPLILLVDDDPQIQDLYYTKLSNSGFKVSQARNGEEGLAMARREKPDLILLDVLMPVMDGAKMLVELKKDEEIKNTKIIILTSLQDRPEDVKFAKEAGAVDFVNKDIDFKDLLKKMNESLGIK